MKITLTSINIVTYANTGYVLIYQYFASLPARRSSKSVDGRSLRGGIFAGSSIMEKVSKVFPYRKYTILIVWLFAPACSRAK